MVPPVPPPPSPSSSDVPVHVVLPVRDHLGMTRAVIEDLRAQGGCERIRVYDNGSGPATVDWLASQRDLEAVDAAGWPLYAMWNDGVRRAMAGTPVCDVAILNNDLRLGPAFLRSLSTALRSRPDLWAVCPAYDGHTNGAVDLVTGTYKDGGLAGFAFMVRGEVFDRVGFDEDFHWWFGDDDLVAQIHDRGGLVAIARTTWVEHVNGGSQTMLDRVPGIWPDLIADYERMLAKWGHA